MTPPISYWHDSLEAGDTLTPPRAALPGDRQVNIAVVGAGFAGLWSAYYLLKADPSLHIVVIDAETAGFGASGRNGGWCVPEAGTPLDVLDQEGGAGTGGAMLRAIIALSTKWAKSRNAKRSIAASRKAARCGSLPTRHNYIVCAVASRYSRATAWAMRIKCSR